MIEFHLETRSGVPTYLQLVQQVRQAIRLGILRPGDQLPTVKEVYHRAACFAQPTIGPVSRDGTAVIRTGFTHHFDRSTWLWMLSW